MTKDTIQNIFIGILLGGVILLAGGVYYLAMQVQSSTEGIARIEQNVADAMKRADAGFRCIDSGGSYEGGQCACGPDYFLENGMCMGQDGLTKKQLEEIKANQERMMMDSGTVELGKQMPENLDKLSFSYPDAWDYRENPDPATQASSGLVGTFYVGNQQQAGIYCPDDFTPGPDSKITVDESTQAYQREGESYTAKLRIERIENPGDVNDVFWHSAIDFGDPQANCDLVFQAHEPSQQERDIYKSILSSIK